ncbi:MAG TPA: helix-turn-helix domain-containing protein [Myxococcota bacterium]|nr:helix-turn-helix domain-containing protein [Myxococcota bacterium]
MSAAPSEEHREGRPAPCLRPFIARYGGSRRSGFAPREHGATPSRHLTLIVSFGAPIEIAAMPRQRRRPGRFQAFVAGLHDAPARVRDDGASDLVHAFVTPLGARALFGVPAQALASRVVELADLLGARAHELVERAADARDWSARFAILDRVLARGLASARPAPEVGWAWRQLLGAGGRVAVTALARELGWSRRHLSERFRDELGLGPKAAARVLRFEQACSRLAGPERPSLGEVAAACGYADQSHLTREWVALSGATPRAWLAQELPFLQDYELEAVVDSAS